MRKLSGYTLIELLLVLAVLTLLTTVSVKWYRQHWWERHVENMAMEMTNQLSAALNYQTEHERWPSSHQDLATCWQAAPPLDDFVQFYSPLHQQRNLLGQHYCYGHLSSSTTLFWVGLHLSETQASTVGSRLKTYLPNAFLTSDPRDPEHPPCDTAQCFLVSEVTGQASQRPSGTQVVGLGICKPQGAVDPTSEHSCEWLGTEGAEPKTALYRIHFQCPTLMEKKVMATINYLDVGKARGEPYVLRSLALDTDCSEQSGCLLKIIAARSDGHSVTTGAQGHVGANYLAYCQPQPSPSP